MSVSKEDAYLACKVGRLTRDEPSKGEVSQMQRRLEWFAARLSQGAQGEAAAWIHAHEVDALRERFNNVVAAAIHPQSELPTDAVKLYTHPAERAAVPEGWVLVPREPTSQMIEAGSSSLKSDMDITRRPQGGTRQRGARNAYVSMLSAAPTLAGKEGMDDG